MLAVLTLTSSRRLTASLILLALPVLDAGWVLVGRYLKHRHELKSPLDLLKISDKTHIHHRLLDLGFTTKQTLGIILAVYLIFCAFGYYMAGFSEETLALIGVVAFFLGLFAILRWLQGRVKLQQIEAAEKLAASPKVRVESETPEERYAY